MEPRRSFDSNTPDIRPRQIAPARVWPSENSASSICSVRDDHHDGQASNDEFWKSLDNDVLPRERATRVHAQRNLEWWDVSSLIINKMVGTGIFTGPWLTFYYTNNKGLTMAFWIIGFLFTLQSMWLYLEFARDLPYTGGEMVYLDHLFKKPRLLMYTWYTVYFVTLYTTCTNSMQFAKYTLIAADVENLNPDRRLICFIAFTITTFTCLLLYFDSLTSRYANATTALAKVILLICVLASGFWYISSHQSYTDSWGATLPSPYSSHLGWTQGLLLVFFSFHGWENATFVSGEIPKYTVLRNGFIVAVVLVGILYTSIVAVFCASIPPNVDMAQTMGFSTYIYVWFGDSDRAKQAAAILISLSALGSMISVAYTCVRVKQIIGWTNILPLSNLWRRTSLSRLMSSIFSPSERDSWQSAVNQAVAVREGTPEGGLLLHYIVSLVFICLTQAFDDLTTAIQSSGNVLIYGHFFYEAAAGLGYAIWFKPKKQSEREIPVSEWNAPEPFRWFTHRRVGMVILGFLTSIVGVFVIIIELFERQGRWYFCTLAALTALSTLYWFSFVRCRPDAHTSRLSGLSFRAQVHGKDDYNNPWRQCSQCARLDEGEGVEHRHREDGYLHFNSVEFLSNPMGRCMESISSWFGKTGEQYNAGQGAHDFGATMQMASYPKRPISTTATCVGSESANVNATRRYDINP